MTTQASSASPLDITVRPGFDENDAPPGFLAKPRGEQFCYECAFHTGSGHDFKDCMEATGRHCAPSHRKDKLWVVFVAMPNVMLGDFDTGERNEPQMQIF